MKTFSSLLLLARSVRCRRRRARWAWTPRSGSARPARSRRSRSGTVDVGVIGVSDDSQKFGDFTGLNRQGALPGARRQRALSRRRRRLRPTHGVRPRPGHPLARLRRRPRRPVHVEAGLRRDPALPDRRRVDALPRQRRLAADAAGGLSGRDTASMPLAHHAAAGRPRVPSGSASTPASRWIAGRAWSTQLDVRRDVRDGTAAHRRLVLLSSASQLVAPLDQTTDQLAAVGRLCRRAPAGERRLPLSMFRNDDAVADLVEPVHPGRARRDTGQLALPPGNQFHNWWPPLGYEVTPTIRFSGDIAFGRMTQNEAFLPITLNSTWRPACRRCRRSR